MPGTACTTQVMTTSLGYTLAETLGDSAPSPPMIGNSDSCSSLWGGCCSRLNGCSRVSVGGVAVEQSMSACQGVQWCRSVRKERTSRPVCEGRCWLSWCTSCARQMRQEHALGLVSQQCGRRDLWGLSHKADRQRTLTCVQQAHEPGECMLHVSGTCCRHPIDTCWTHRPATSRAMTALLSREVGLVLWNRVGHPCVSRYG